MTLRPKLTKEERERRRRQNEEWRERKFREKQLKEFMSRLHHLFFKERPAEKSPATGLS